MVTMVSNLILYAKHALSRKKRWQFLLVLASITLVAISQGYSKSKVALESLPKNTSPEIKQLIERLYSNDPLERATAVGKLGESGTKAVPAIPFVIPILGETEPVSRQIAPARFESTSIDKEAIKLLVKLGQPAVDPLIHALNDKHSGVRKNAAEALGEIGDTRAIDPLMTTLLEDDDGTVRKCAAEALGRIGDSRSLKALTIALRDRKSKVQESAGEAVQVIINNLKTKHELTTLHVSLKSRETVVRRMASKALSELKDPLSVDSLIEALNDNDSQVQRNVVGALKGIGKPAVVPLSAFLRDDNPALCLEVIKLLGEIGDNTAVGYLVGVVKHFRSWRLRCEAAGALGKIRDPRIVGSLIEALNDRNLCVREAAAKSLKEVGKPAVEPLVESLRDENYDVCSRSIVLLGEIGDSRAVEPLVGVLKNFELWALRFEAARSLGMIRDPRAIGPLTDALSDKDEYVREGAEGALREITGKEYKRDQERQPRAKD